MTEKEIEDKFIEVNERFLEFINVLPFIELQENDSFEGRHCKLKTQLDEDGAFKTAAMIFFELQYMLHTHNNRMDVVPAKKMLVSELILSPIIPDAAFRRGFIIKIEYIK